MSAVDGPGSDEEPKGGPGHAHRLRNLAFAVRLAVDLLDPEDLAARRIQAAADGLFDLADDIESDAGGLPR